MVREEPTIQTKTCIHCGLDSGEEDFCCGGCETAYKIIHEWGLDAFYEKATASKRPIGDLSFAKYEIFDNAEFLESHTQKRSDGLREAYFSIEGLYCSACIWLIEKLPEMLSECRMAEVFYSRSEIYLRWVDQPRTLSKILILLSKMGYDTQLLDIDFKKKKKFDREIIRLGVTAGFALAVMHLGLYFLGAWKSGMDESMARQLGFVSAALSLPVIFYGAEGFFKSSWAALKIKRLHPDLLIVVSLLGGFVFSLRHSYLGSFEVYYDSICMIVFLLLLGRMILRRATDAFSKSQAGLIRRLNGEWVSTESLVKGDKVCLNNKQIVPVDSVLRSKEAWFDFSVLSGESTPLRCLTYTEIPQGAKLLSSEIEIEVRESFQNSSIAKLRRSLASSVDPVEAGMRAGLYEQIFVGSIFVIAMICFFIFPIDEAVKKAIGVLVVACPCALSLSSPLVLDAFKRQAYRLGLFVGNLQRVFGLKDIQTINFDKTGTLVDDQMELENAPFDQMNSAELQILYSICLKSQHPLSRALAFSLWGKFQPEVLDVEVNEVPGSGIGLKLNSNEYFYGKPKIRDGTQPAASFFINDREIKFLFTQKERPFVPEVVTSLKELGLKLRLLTGDSSSSTSAFVEHTGLNFDEICAEKSAEEKEAYNSSVTMMVGDGINDARAMSRSGFGVGIHGSAEHSLKAAAAYLMKKDLRIIPQLIQAGRKASSTKNLNLSISAIYNLISISLVLFGAIGPIVCAIMMPISSFSVLILSNYSKYFKIE